MRLLWIILIAAAVSSCATTGSVTTRQPMASVAAARTGDSMETAIVIDASNESEGVDAEYRWIREHYPNAKLGSQALLTPPTGKFYDRMEFTTPDGIKHQVYFDITGFFGKM